MNSLTQRSTPPTRVNASRSVWSSSPSMGASRSIVVMNSMLPLVTFAALRHHTVAKRANDWTQAAPSSACSIDPRARKALALQASDARAMDHLDSTSSAALFGSVLLLLSMLWMRRRQSHASRSRSNEALDTVQAWPPQAVRVMTQAERQAYELLRRAVPNHLVLAQVPLSRFISVPTRQSYGEWLNRAGRLSADLLICDEHSRVIAAIDVRAPDESSRSRERHERLGHVLEAAGIAVQVWRSSKKPDATDYGQLDPVSSGFFDDLEAVK
ncbi:MAG: DUF2726 domain-containing protein [Betaproteobacteria bacterium]|nr:MAG: DUF2726 domain-containing protein [Betaproteobacteria bacterium]